MALVDGMPAAASFVYLPNAAIAYISFAVADPDLGPKQTLLAVETAVGACVDIGRQFLGARGFIELVTHTPAMHRIATRRLGFTDGNAAQTSFIAIGDIDPSIISG